MQTPLGRRTVIALATLGFAAPASVALAAPVTFTVPLSGAEQVPPVQTSGSGTAKLTWDSSTRKVTWSIAYSGLSSDATMAHFHPAPRGKNGPAEIWLTKKGEPVSSPITGEATLTPEKAKQFEAGDLYINVHTKDHPQGEIRGQVVPPKP